MRSEGVASVRYPAPSQSDIPRLVSQARRSTPLKGGLGVSPSGKIEKVLCRRPEEVIQQPPSLLFYLQIAVGDGLASAVKKNEAPQVTRLGAHYLAREKCKEGKPIENIDERS